MPLPGLNDEQRRTLCSYLTVGCDLETAARLVRSTRFEVLREAEADPAFAFDLRAAEAAAELAHQHNVQLAGRQEKHWRASAWWLERRSPERYAARPPHALTARELEAFIAELVGIIRDELGNSPAVGRLLRRLEDQGHARPHPAAAPAARLAEPPPASAPVVLDETAQDEP